MKHVAASVERIATAVLSGWLFLTPAFAASQDDGSFSALQGVDAQALSADEMQAIQGLMSLTNLNELIAAIKADPRIGDNAERFLVAYWTKLYYSLNGTRWQPLLDAAFSYLQKNVYTSMCGVNADFCAQFR